MPATVPYPLPTAPSTPQRNKANAEINRILQALRAAGVSVEHNDGSASPSARGRSAAVRITKMVQYLYYNDKTSLMSTVGSLLADIRSSDVNLDTFALAALEDAQHLARHKPSDHRSKTLQDPKTPSERVDSFLGAVKPLSPDSSDNPPPKTRRTNSFEACLTSKADVAKSLRQDHTAVATPSATASAAGSQPPPSTYGGLDACEIEAVMSFVVDPDQFTDTIIFPGDDTPTIEAKVGHGSELHHAAAGVDNRTALVVLHSRTQAEAQTQATVDDSALKRQSYLVSNLPAEPLCDFALPECLANVSLDLKWAILYACKIRQASIQNLERQCTASPKDPNEGIVMDWIKQYMSPTELDLIHTTSLTANVTVNLTVDRKGRDFPESKSLLHLEPGIPSSRAMTRLERKFGVARFLTVSYTGPSDQLRRQLNCASDDLFNAYLRNFSPTTKTSLGLRVQVLSCPTCRPPGTRDRAQAIVLCRIRPWPGQRDDPRADRLGDSFAPESAHVGPQILGTPRAKPVSYGDINKLSTESDGAEESSCFNDPLLEFSQGTQDPPLMNDGCSRISSGAVRMICDALNITQDRPTAFQARINGAKGMWVIDGAYNDDQDDVWIQISPSQLKCKPRDSDLDNATCEPDIWSFEVVAFSSMPRQSGLHLDFIPIFEERGVPLTAITDVVKEQLHLDFQGFIEATHDPISLRRWLSAEFAGKEVRNRESGLQWLASLPADELEHVILMLESGFDCHTNHSLAEMVVKQVDFWLQDMLENLKIRSPKTCMPYGIADLWGCLQPGEIFLAFSQPFRDEVSGTSISHLEGDVLVARHPAMRRSDIQRVKAVYRPELNHLRDVVIFPTRGCIPLAHKLQGGDYDGDTFWICWDQRIVQPFRNAPIETPVEQMASYGIVQDTETLAEVLTPASAFKNALEKSLKFAMRPNLLGVVTNYHKRLAYAKNSLSDDRVRIFADIHDIIIDASKNGYKYSEHKFNDFIAERGWKRKLPALAYEEALKNPGVDAAKLQKPNAKGRHILDNVVFECVIPQVAFFRQQLDLTLGLRLPEGSLPVTDVPDEDLLQPYKDLEQLATQCATAKSCLDRLALGIPAVFRFWSDQRASRGDGTDLRRTVFRALTTETHRLFLGLVPAPPHGPTAAALVRAWLGPPAPGMPSQWDMWCASALYHHRAAARSSARVKARSKLAFALAGRELCAIKAYARGEARVVVGDVYAVLKPRKERRRLYRGRWLRAADVEDEGDG